MIETYRTITSSELFATEIGISGAPIPTNGPGKKYPFLKYFIVGGLVVSVFAFAYYFNKQRIPKIKPLKNEEGTK